MPGAKIITGGRFQQLQTSREVPAIFTSRSLLRVCRTRRGGELAALSDQPSAAPNSEADRQLLIAECDLNKTLRSFRHPSCYDGGAKEE